jgi:predicted esterase
VIALHGDGGSENMFFEAHGQGAAVTQAARRNWAFVAPRTSGTSVADVLEWIRVRRKQPVERVFIMGHSSGGGFALNAGNIKPKPSAIAVFAPASRSLPASIEGIPVFASIGKQDLLFANMKPLGQVLSSRKDSEYEELEPCEHLMIVADSIQAAYRFFDAHAGR